MSALLAGRGDCVLTNPPILRIFEIPLYERGSYSLRASAKQDMPSIYTGAIAFTTEDAVNPVEVASGNCFPDAQREETVAASGLQNPDATEPEAPDLRLPTYLGAKCSGHMIHELLFFRLLL